MLSVVLNADSAVADVASDIRAGRLLSSQAFRSCLIFAADIGGSFLLGHHTPVSLVVCSGILGLPEIICCRNLIGEFESSLVRRF